DRDPGRRRAAGAGNLFLVRRRAADHGAGHPRHRVLRGRRRPFRMDTRARAGHPDHRARGHGPAGRAVRDDQAAERAGVARPGHHLHPLLLLQRRGVATGGRLRRDELDRATSRAAAGARLAAGLEDVTGSLTPGKRADLVLLDATALNMAPVHDPVAAVTLSADVSNVDTVIVDGVVRKRGGKLLADVTAAWAGVEASRDYLV